MILTESANAVVSYDDYSPQRSETWLNSSPLPERPRWRILVKRAQRRSPVWLEDIVDAMSRLLELPEGWDSYGSARIALPAVHTALKVLVLTGFDGPAPTVVPTVRGGIQLEWETQYAGVEIEFDPDGTITTLIEDDQGAQEESSTSPLNPFLVEALNRVMQPLSAPRHQ